MTDKHFFNLLAEIVTYSVFSDPGLDTKKLHNKLFSFSSKKRINNILTSNLMERLYLDKKQWNKTSDFDKIICLDFLIDQNFYNEEKTLIPDENLKGWINDLLLLAKNNIEMTDLTSKPEGKIMLKRYFVEPINKPPYRRPYIDTGHIILPQGEFVQYTREFLDNFYWGKELVKTAENIFKCAADEIKG